MVRLPLYKCCPGIQISDATALKKRDTALFANSTGLARISGLQLAEQRTLVWPSFSAMDS
jgi:hypothetical protein